MSEKRPKWETTREPNLLRNRASGRYYGRFTISGKQKWLNLNTDVWSVAKLRLADERAKIERTRQTVENLLPLGLAAIRTTLDGPPDIHNTQRPFVSGKGSFNVILANLAAVHEIVPLNIGGNYTGDNYRRFPEMLDLLLEAGINPAKLRDVSFSSVMPKADGSGSGDHAATCACTSEPWAIEANLFLRAEIIRRGFPTAKLGPGACMIEFEKDWVVGHDGAIYKCPVFMGDERMRVGTLADGIGDYRDSHKLDFWKTDECLDCAYLPLCFGGCRFFRKLKTGAIDGVDCRRAMLDASLEAIVLQDLLPSACDYH